MTSLIETMSSKIKINNLQEFKQYLEEESNNLSNYVNDIKYTYNLDLQIYSKDTSKITKLNPSTVFSSYGITSQEKMANQMMSRIQATSMMKF